MEDVMRRLGSLEKDVSVIKAEVSAIKVEVAGIAAQLPHMATKADVSDLKSSMLQWTISTLIAGIALAFTIAKFVH